MATNLALDDDLISDAVKAGKHKTKREAVTRALEEYVSSRKRLAIFDLIGKVEYFDDVDHKQTRRSRKR